MAATPKPVRKLYKMHKKENLHHEKLGNIAKGSAEKHEKSMKSRSKIHPMDKTTVSKLKSRFSTTHKKKENERHEAYAHMKSHGG